MPTAWRNGIGVLICEYNARLLQAESIRSQTARGYVTQ